MIASFFALETLRFASGSRRKPSLPAQRIYIAACGRNLKPPALPVVVYSGQKA